MYTIDDVIEQLQKIKSEHGNIEVRAQLRHNDGREYRFRTTDELLFEVRKFSDGKLVAL